MTHFEELLEAKEFMGLVPLITVKDLKKRFRELSKELHPDKGGDSERMQQLHKSYKLILEYMESYRFRLSKEEVSAQFPCDEHFSRFKF